MISRAPRSGPFLTRVRPFKNRKIYSSKTGSPTGARVTRPDGPRRKNCVSARANGTRSCWTPRSVRGKRERDKGRVPLTVCPFRALSFSLRDIRPVDECVRTAFGEARAVDPERKKAPAAATPIEKQKERDRRNSRSFVSPGYKRNRESNFARPIFTVDFSPLSRVSRARTRASLVSLSPLSFFLFFLVSRSLFSALAYAN